MFASRRLANGFGDPFDELARYTARSASPPFAALLTIAVCAMLGGARSFAAIGEWTADLPADARAGLGIAGRIPGPVTIWRVLVRVDPAASEAAIRAWIRARLDAVDTAGHQPPRRHRRARQVLERPAVFRGSLARTRSTDTQKPSLLTKTV
ncbi:MULTISPECIES: transposase family protein [unclassified Frankia]|uniref:transposase family protein n=1 Tax=unclassified Frankia TaxID=2632575 RepID=UPI002025489D